jgi:hypothetical protein
MPERFDATKHGLMCELASDILAQGSDVGVWLFESYGAVVGK